MSVETEKPTGMRTFFIIWFGQLVSTLGSGLTGFALGVWIYQETGSTTLFAMNMLAFALPTMLITPLAGALVDRWNRRWVMIMSDTGAGLSTLAIWLLLSSNQLEIWHIYIATAVAASFTAFQWPAHSAATTMLVPKEHLGRAGGMVQIGQAISQLLSPAAAGLMFITWGLNGVIMVDFVTFGVAVASLLVIKIPEPKRSEDSEQDKDSLWQDMLLGWKYIFARKGLLSLLLYFAVFNLAFGFIGPIIVPMALDLGTADQAGYAFSAIGLGMLVGTLVMSAWGGPKRRVLGILGTGVWMGVMMMFLGLRPSLLLVAVTGFGAMLALPISSGSSQALWQTKTPPDVQGRVFAVRRFIAQFTNPIAIVLAGPLVDNFFQPLMDVGGPLDSSIGQIIGVGPGRGAGLMFMTMGAVVALASVAFYGLPRLRHVEDEIPDVEIIAKGDTETETDESASVVA